MHLSQGEIHALRLAAEQAWDDDTRHPAYQGHPLPCAGQCYVTSRWLADRLGGHVARKDGHYFHLSPEQTHALDLTGDLNHTPPADDRLSGLQVDEDDPGLELEPHHRTWRPGPPIYKTTDHPLFADAEIVPSTANDRAARFSARANRAFDTPGLLDRTADLIGSDAYPAETPQAIEDMNQRDMHDEPGYSPGDGEFQFVYANGSLEVSQDHSHEELAQHARVGPDHTGPLATGTIHLTGGQARFEVTGNISGSALFRVLKDYCKHVGWQWGGLTDLEGWPLSDAFAPKSSHRIYFSFTDELLLSTRLARVASAESRIVGYLLIDRISAMCRVVPTRLPQYFASMPQVPRSDMRRLGEAVLEWAADEHLTVIAGDNVIKTIEDLDQSNLYDPNPTQPDDQQYPATYTDERQPGGVYRCPHCQNIYPTWRAYQRHRQQEEPMGDLPDREPNQDGGFPEEPSLGVQEQQPYVSMTHVMEAARVPGFSGHQSGDQYAVAYRHGCAVGYARLRNAKLHETRTVNAAYDLPLLAKIVKVTDMAPKDLVEGPIPFIYDIQEDTIDLGQPNTRTSDIPGQFTPGGIIEGMYEPGGKVYIKSDTNMPYTMRHMLELWYHKNPMLEVKNVVKRNDSGGETKLATHAGGYLAALVAADPAAYMAARQLEMHGGQVFVVGGAVRDALLGKEPKDLDLLVRGVEPDDVDRILSNVGGVDLTGKDFGVFRFRYKGSEVEIALPRRERSTGDGHRDFAVDVDHTASVEDDLARRDFTVNAIAVEVKTGRVVDPFGGARDLNDGVFRTLSERSLSDDPLRTVRALVLYARHGLVPTADTEQEMSRNAAALSHLPAERIQAELDKLFASADPAAGIRLAHVTGVLAYVFPEVDDAFGFDQRNSHHELHLGEHLLHVLERTAAITDDPDVRLAALLHDIGKPASAWQDPDPSRGMHYYYSREHDLGQDHERVGAEMARERLTALKYPAARIARIEKLVRQHMFGAFTSRRGARKFMRMAAADTDALLNIREADQGGKGIAYPGIPDLNVDKQRDLVAQVRDAAEPTSTSDLAINGHDLIKAGMTPGPHLGAVLADLTAAVIDDPTLNERDILLGMIDA